MAYSIIHGCPFEERRIPARTVLLEAGKVSECLYYVEEGILRESYNHDGKDITLQFFFEGQVVALPIPIFSCQG